MILMQKENTLLRDGGEFNHEGNSKQNSLIQTFNTTQPLGFVQPLGFNNTLFNAFKPIEEENLNMHLTSFANRNQRSISNQQN